MENPVVEWGVILQYIVTVGGFGMLLGAALFVSVR